MRHHLVCFGLIGVVLGSATGASEPADGTWLYTQRGTGFGVKGIGLVVYDYQGNLIVLARASELVNLDGGYERPAPDAFEPQDRLLAKYGPDQRLFAVRKVGETDFPHICQLVADRNGDVYCTGYSDRDIRLFMDGEELRLSNRGRADFFLLKWTADMRLAFGRHFGGPGYESSCGLALDPRGHIVLVGEFAGALDLPSEGGAITLQTADSKRDIFVLKLDRTGTTLWARHASGAASLLPPGVGVDEQGNCYVTGGFEPTLRFTGGPRPCVLTSRGGWDFFLARYDADGGLAWARDGGGSENDYGVRVLLDKTGYSYVTGRYNQGAVFGEGDKTMRLEALGRADMFMACYTPAGELLGALRVGGHGATIDAHWTIVMDEFGSRYLVGPSAESAQVWRTPDPDAALSTTAPPATGASGDFTVQSGNPPSRFESIGRRQDGSIQILLEGRRNGTYVIEVSADLSDWRPVSTIEVSGGQIIIEDPEAAQLPMRFYRVRQP